MVTAGSSSSRGGCTFGLKVYKVLIPAVHACNAKHLSITVLVSVCSGRQQQQGWQLSARFAPARRHCHRHALVAEGVGSQPALRRAAAAQVMIQLLVLPLPSIHHKHLLASACRGRQQRQGQQLLSSVAVLMGVSLHHADYISIFFILRSRQAAAAEVVVHLVLRYVRNELLLCTPAMPSIHKKNWCQFAEEQQQGQQLSFSVATARRHTVPLLQMRH
jgi:hypothetical protein